MSTTRKHVSQTSLVKVDDKNPNIGISNPPNNLSSLTNLLDNIHHHNLETYYPREESLFKRRIDKLNLKFYLETEKYLNSKEDMEKCQDQLFIILFKQISLYIEEVERLNKLLRERNEMDKSAKEKIEEMNLLEKEKIESQQAIFTFKAKVNLLEKKLNEKSQNEEKLKKEIESLKRQITFYKDKIKVNINERKSNEVNKRNKGIGLSVGLSNQNNTGNINSSASKQRCVSPGPVNKEELTINDKQDSIELKRKLLIAKKRSISDNNPTPSGNPNLPSTNVMISLQLKKENSGVSSNVGSPVQNMKREINKSSNAVHEHLNLSKQFNFSKNPQSDVKSPTRTKSTLNENFLKKVTISEGKPNIKTNLNNSIGFVDLNTMSDIITSTYKYYSDEIKELENFERLLKEAKGEFMTSSTQFTTEDSSYPFSDGEEYSSYPRIERQQISQTSKISSSANKKNHPMFSSVTIDLMGRENNSSSSLNINPVAKSQITYTNLAAKHLLPEIRIKTGSAIKKRSDSNKSDNSSQVPQSRAKKPGK